MNLKNLDYENKSKIEDIIEDMYDTMVLKPINELEIYRKCIKKLFELFGYKTPLI